MISGDKFDRYVIERELGRGGMGRVYRAHDTRRGTAIALKVLTTDTSTPRAVVAQARARLAREARAGSSFTHANAVTIYEAGEHDGRPFIAMELVEGESLRAILVRGELPEWPERLRWLTDAARALAASHAAGLVHRDVKPENVMLSSEGEVKILDFGIARPAWAAGTTSSARHTGGMKTLTPNGQLIGTPHYMAPEYILGESLDGRADQFAWGVMAHEVLVGKLPWKGNNDIEIMSAILKQPIAPLQIAVPELPLALDEAVRRALSKKPEERFASMDALVAELEALLEEAGVEARPAARAPRPRSLGRPLVALAAAIIVAACGYAALTAR